MFWYQAYRLKPFNIKWLYSTPKVCRNGQLPINKSFESTLKIIRLAYMFWYQAYGLKPFNINGYTASPKYAEMGSCP